MENVWIDPKPMLRSVEMGREGCGGDVKDGYAVLFPAILIF